MVSLNFMELLARNSLRIVHVENYDGFALLIELALKRAGFEQPIVRCNDGVLALHYFSMIEPEHSPHVILLDLHMPNMNGLEVLHWLRHEHSEQDVAVYLLTSSDDPEDRRQAASEGVTEYILKSPFFDKLIQKLDDLIAETNRHRVGDAGRKHDATADISSRPFAELSHALANA
jgi:CheY-like chemotaxis protein